MQTEPKVDLGLEAALDHLADRVGVGETQEVARVRKSAQQGNKTARRCINRDGHYTRHTVTEARAATEQAARRYP